MFKHKRTDNRGRRRLSYANVMSTLAVFLVVAGGSAFAASLAANSVNSKTVKDNSLKSIDLRDGKAVSTDDVIDASLTGTDLADNSVTAADVDESTLSQVPDSARLQGRTAASFLSNNVYKAESTLGPGTTLGDGTQVISQACNPGDVLLSGGPANIRSTSTLLESFPSPGVTNSWTARINKNGQTDDFSVVVLCVNQ
ncbi:MAG: hypothetical protein ACJ75R_08635 [Solirubrobacterales bacterium]